MPGSFWRQFAALCRKNWIILWRHRWINLIRCLILPIAYAAFFGKAQDFFSNLGNLGEGSIRPIQAIPPDLLDYKLIWSPPPSAYTNSTTNSAVNELMGRTLEGVYGEVVRVNNASEVEAQCRQSFNLRSNCFAAVVFGDIDTGSRTLNYTLRGDGGLIKVDVDNPKKDDVQQRFLPLQWKLESTFIQMATGTRLDRPLNWEYTNQNNTQAKEDNRISFMYGIRSLICLAFFLAFLGVVYQLPGSMAQERAVGLTSHLEAMGCRKSSRVISWHLSVSSAYFPAWLIISIIFRGLIFKNTNIGLMIVSYVVTGLSLASWTQLVAVPFANAPTLAAITATFLAIILAIGALLTPSNIVIQLVLTLIFPPMYYIFFTKAQCAFEYQPRAVNILQRSPARDAPILGLLIIAIIDIFLFPLVATWLESRIYGVRPPEFVGFWSRLFRRRGRSEIPGGPDDVLSADTAVKLDHLSKTYNTKTLGLFGGKSVTAIEDLSFQVPKGEIFCLLGRNGAAKSTTLHIIARLISASGGRIRYSPDLHLGIASQKDVLWDELNCKQHIELWRAVKTTKGHEQLESDIDLLARCDLAPKIRFLSKNLSGGQKRKLQLACALAGGSNLLLLDEISSGLDPLSRRAIWKLIVANRGTSTIMLTTHFLDEADYLGDSVAVLQAPGRLLALDKPVGLKTKLGKGFVLAVDQGAAGGGASSATTAGLKEVLQRELPGLRCSSFRGKQLFVTGSTDVSVIRRLVSAAQRYRDTTGGKWDFQVNSSTLESVFLDLNAEPDNSITPSTSPTPSVTAMDIEMQPVPIAPIDRSLSLADEDDKLSSLKDVEQADTPSSSRSEKITAAAAGPVVLTPGSKRSYLASIPLDAYTIFRKRLTILRRAFLLPLVGIVVVVCASCIPLFFISDRVQTCAFETRARRLQRLSYPSSIYPFAFSPVIYAPNDAFAGITLPTTVATGVANNETFIQLFQSNYTNITYGGVSLPAQIPSANSQPLFAWEGSSLQSKGLSALNLLNNALIDKLSPPGGTNIANYFRINLNFSFLPSPSFFSTAQAMKWIAFFGLGVAIWPAFAVIYPTQERVNNVRANQYSNGASPVSLWLGHLLHEMPAILLVSTVITAIFAGASSQFNGPGYVWLCFVLYGISATLYAYLFALWLGSALAAWAVVAGTNVILFLLYLATYLLILTYDLSAAAPNHITICHFTIALINPVPNIIRAILVSVNLFNLLCDGFGNYSSQGYGSILQFGGPILYMVLQAIFAFSVLVYVDSGAPIPAFLRRKDRYVESSPHATGATAAATVPVGRGDGSQELQVERLRKRYSGQDKYAVDGVSFGVGLGDNFALIGPNGAGKTTTLACIRGVELPNGGDVKVAGHSVVKARNAARSYLGVCPQVNAIDTHLTVRQHLWLYGRLKGVPRRALAQDIDVLLSAAGLGPKADHLATSLSGGNQRKLGLAIALIGDRPVVLIDEFSSGVDPFSKREAWSTLAALTKERAVVMTTHSMEEVDALASNVGIIASKMLAVGTPQSLKSRFATYEIHLTADLVQPTLATLHANGYPRATASADALTRISVPGITDNDLGKLLELLERIDGKEAMTLHEASTETAFLEIVREHNVQEEAGKVEKPSFWRRLLGRK